MLNAACADAPRTSDEKSSPPGAKEERVAVYETLIRHLADPDGGQPIYVPVSLCISLMTNAVDAECPDRIRDGEQRELKERLADLGEVAFIGEGDQGPSPDRAFPQIVLGPIVEKPDGLRVEGGVVCGELCGSGSVYIVVATDSGYAVAGIDDRYGQWIT